MMRPQRRICFVVMHIVACMHILSQLSSSSSIDCQNTSQCINQTLSISGGSVKCRGTTSCAYSTVIDSGSSSDGNTFGCDGKKSCIHCKHVTTSVEYSGDIRGYLGLGWTSTIVNSDTACLGEAACIEIDNMTVSSLNCGGVASCANITGLYNVQTIQAGGIYSLRNSIVYSDSSSKSLTAELWGYYAGYNASIYCLDGHSCTVNCGINGCYGLNYHCLSGSTDNCVVNCNDTSGIACPNGWHDGEYTGNYDYSYSHYNYSDLIRSLMLIEKNINSMMGNDLNKKYSLIQGWNYSYEFEKGLKYDDPNDQYCQNETFRVSYNGAQSTKVTCNNYEDCMDSSIYLNNNGSMDNINICCAGQSSCYGSSLYLRSNNNIIYCDGDESCSSAKIYANYGNSIFIRGSASIRYVSMYNFNTLVISGSQGLDSQSLSNGEYLYCLGDGSCYGFEIANVSVIIAGGSSSLKLATIKSNGRNMDIYLVGYQSVDSAKITCHGSDICTIYYLHESIFDGLSQYTCESGYTCSLASESISKLYEGEAASPVESATAQPSLSPTASPWNSTSNSNVNTTSDSGSGYGEASTSSFITSDHAVKKSTETTEAESGSGSGLLRKEIDELASSLNDSMVIIVIFMIILTIVLICWSKSLHKTKHEAMRDMLSNKLLYNTESVGTKQYGENTYTSGARLSNSARDGKNSSKRTGTVDIVDYVAGFGKNSNHFIIGLIVLEIFDVFTDVCYLIELQTFSYNVLFTLFCLSLLLTIFLNFVILVYFIKREFDSNGLFLNWFYEHSGFITAIIVLLSLTDISMLPNVFTSQIFGHSIFYCPISMKGINTIQTFSVLSIAIEHLPQLIIQIYVIFIAKTEHFDAIIFAALIVNVIDIIFVTTRGIMWLVIRLTLKSQSKVVQATMTQDEFGNDIDDGDDL